MEGEETWACQALNVLSSVCVRLGVHKIHHTWKTTKSQHWTRPGKASNTNALPCPQISLTILTPNPGRMLFKKNIPKIQHIGISHSVYPPRLRTKLGQKSTLKEEQSSSSSCLLPCNILLPKPMTSTKGFSLRPGHLTVN